MTVLSVRPLIIFEERGLNKTVTPVLENSAQHFVLKDILGLTQLGSFACNSEN
jgi:hypothetical protein